MSELIDKDAFLKQERKWYCENCDRRKGVKNGRKCFVYEIGEVPCRACDVDDVLDDLECFETITAPRWVRVEDGLPNSQELVIVGIKDTAGDTPFSYTSCGWLTTDKEYWIVDNDVCDYVVAWMPLPEPPGEEA